MLLQIGLNIKDSILRREGREDPWKANNNDIIIKHNSSESSKLLIELYYYCSFVLCL